MENKHEPRFAGRFSFKGYYIALLLCAAVVACAIWMASAEQSADVGFEQESTVVSTVQLKPAEELLPAAPVAEKPLEEELVPVFAAEDEPLPLYFIWPVSGMIERGHSMDVLCYDRTMADWRTHDGWDISAAVGSHVLAAADGTVSAIYSDDLLGTVVEIDHGEGLVSCYANLAVESAVSPGQSVQVGDVIGTVGDTAMVETGENAHLHFAMRLNGISADPAGWLPER